MNIAPVSPETLVIDAVEFHCLLRDAVEGGASVGFTLPLAAADVSAYWRGVGAEIQAGHRLLLAARDAAGRLAGAGQLVLETRANGRHRAEVQRLMVMAVLRGAGIGTALMAALEQAAREQGRTLVHLDTSVGASGAAAFYERLGYQFAGGIPDYTVDPAGQPRANAIYYKRI
ncbi:MAG: GNAT family N-acetyltransferase [Opitutaceae bacterium]|nr:GNAT family N-acetyltransferase [Opitutaceae bacterium]